SCAVCRRKKVKCSGSCPCDYCRKRDLECHLPRSRRRVYSVEYVQEMKSRLAQYEKSNQAQTPCVPAGSTRPSGADRVSSATGSPHDFASASSAPPPVTRDSPVYEPRHYSSAPNSDMRQDQNGEPSLPECMIMIDTPMSSTHIFGSRIQDMLNESPRGREKNLIPAAEKNTGASKGTSHCYIAPTSTTASPELPAREDAHRLLEAVDFFIGHTQHYFDIRELADHVDLFYQGQLCSSPTGRLFHLKILLVLAVGKLILGESDDCSLTPGNSLFLSAQTLLPNLSDLYKSERHGVEVLGLVAFYMQSTNRKDEAYLYINSALRLAITHGIHRMGDGSDRFQSEKTHLNRLWWTIYVNEKRLAAATGNPSSTNHDFANPEKPQKAFGFVPASPLRLNIVIAEATGRILNTLYRRNGQTEAEVIPNIHSIIHDLQRISRELPLGFPKAINSLTPRLSMRTSASLHLMLYQQAILLTIRPIMLHVARLILRRNEPIYHSSITTFSIGRLFWTGTEAARRLLEIALVLKREGILAIFGFIDLDATFSAAFVMLLTAIFNTISDDNDHGQAFTPSPGLSEALEVLRYLSNRGNPFAMERLRELEKAW
ncbi:hypothetical protein BO94DRAFT_428520, partial [Aspergillus sclerotioniger CBS 115572]